MTLVTRGGAIELRPYWGVRKNYPSKVTAAPSLWNLWLEQEKANPYVKPESFRMIRTKRPREMALPVKAVKSVRVFVRLTGQEITYWMERRDDARKAGRYDEADRIRSLLWKYGYKIKDGVDGSTTHGRVNTR